MLSHDTQQAFRSIAHDAIDAHREQRPHLAFVVDRPNVHGHSAFMSGVNEFSGHDAKSMMNRRNLQAVHGQADASTPSQTDREPEFKYLSGAGPVSNLGDSGSYPIVDPPLSRACEDAVLGTMGADDLPDPFLESAAGPLEFDVDPHPGQAAQHLLQGGNSDSQSPERECLASVSGEPESRIELFQLNQGLMIDEAVSVRGSIQSIVVEDDGFTVCGRPDIELDRVDAKVSRSCEGFEGVFWRHERPAPVREG